MKKHKDLSTLFRESEKHLTVQPSSDAWSRMENRLDNAPKSQNGKVVRMNGFRLFSLAASFVLLVGAVYFFQNNDSIDVADEFFKPTFMETLTGAEDCNPYCAVLKARKELPEEYAKGIER